MTDIYADGANYDGIIEAAKNPLIKGFTTNPTLMRAAGVTDYEQFARKVIVELMQTRPETNISLEVFADDRNEMFRQAKLISGWGREYDYNVYVKIPVMNTKGEPNYSLIKDLNKEGVKLNVTAVFTSGQTVNILNSKPSLLRPTNDCIQNKINSGSSVCDGKKSQNGTFVNKIQ